MYNKRYSLSSLSVRSQRTFHALRVVPAHPLLTFLIKYSIHFHRQIRSLVDEIVGSTMVEVDVVADVEAGIINWYSLQYKFIRILK